MYVCVGKALAKAVVGPSSASTRPVDKKRTRGVRACVYACICARTKSGPRQRDSSMAHTPEASRRGPSGDGRLGERDKLEWLYESVRNRLN